MPIWALDKMLTGSKLQVKDCNNSCIHWLKRGWRGRRASHRADAEPRENVNSYVPPGISKEIRFALNLRETIQEMGPTARNLGSRLSSFTYFDKWFKERSLASVFSPVKSESYLTSAPYNRHIIVGESFVNLEVSWNQKWWGNNGDKDCFFSHTQKKLTCQACPIKKGSDRLLGLRLCLPQVCTSF